MSTKKTEKPAELTDEALEAANGGLFSMAGAGTELRTGANPAAGYIGETEKNVWKAPAGIRARDRG